MSADPLRDALEQSDALIAQWRAWEQEEANRKDWPGADRWRYMAGGADEVVAKVRAALASETTDAGLAAIREAFREIVSAEQPHYAGWAVDALDSAMAATPQGEVSSRVVAAVEDIARWLHTTYNDDGRVMERAREVFELASEGAPLASETTDAGYPDPNDDGVHPTHLGPLPAAMTTDALRDAPCVHLNVESWADPSGIPTLWACLDCKQRFYPACPVCIDVGHRSTNGHVALAPLASETTDAPVRAMLDGSPCWCYAPDIEPHEGWVHGSMCKGRRARIALTEADGPWHAADCRPEQRFFGVTCLHCGSMSESEDPRHE